MKLQDIIQRLKETPGISETESKKFFSERFGVDFFIMYSEGSCVLNMSEDDDQIVLILKEILGKSPDFTYKAGNRTCYEWCFNERSRHFRSLQLSNTPEFKAL